VAAAVVRTETVSLASARIAVDGVRRERDDQRVSFRVAVVAGSDDVRDVVMSLRARLDVERIDMITSDDERLIASSDAVVVVIGEGIGRRQLNDPLDRVRLIIRETFRRGATLLPVLTRGVREPEGDELYELPLEFRRLFYDFVRYPEDVERLIRILNAHLDPDGWGPLSAGRTADTDSDGSAPDPASHTSRSADDLGPPPPPRPLPNPPPPPQPPVWSAPPPLGHAPVGAPGGRSLGSGSRVDEVRVGVSAPKRVVVLSPFVTRLATYRPEDRRQAARHLKGARARARPALDVARSRWPRGTKVRVTLGGSDLAVENSVVEFVWDGDVHEAAFDVRVTRDVSEVILRFGVFANGIPVAAPRLEVLVGRGRFSRRTGLQRDQVSAARTAFASYSAKDRARVLDAVIALEAVGLDVFQDCLDLHPAEEWKPRLLQELGTRELFVLFWSKAARESKWVRWELDSILDTRGQDPVCVSPLEIDVPPPERLSHLHFSHPGAWIRAALGQ
jgi:TIR domain